MICLVSLLDFVLSLIRRKDNLENTILLYIIPCKNLCIFCLQGLSKRLGQALLSKQEWWHQRLCNWKSTSRNLQTLLEYTENMYYVWITMWIFSQRLRNVCISLHLPGVSNFLFVFLSRNDFSRLQYWNLSLFGMIFFNRPYSLLSSRPAPAV